MPKRQKSLSRNKAKKKIIIISPPVLLLKKKNSLSLSVVLLPSSSPYCVLLCSLCKGEQQHKEMRREEEMTFSAKL